MIDDKTRQQLLAEARRLVKETNFTAGLCLRLASDAEAAALAAERERTRRPEATRERIREASQQLVGLTARGVQALEAVRYVNNVIQFPTPKRHHNV